jgi:hypothetical protein
MIVRRPAHNSGVVVDEEMLVMFQEIASHRTDADVSAGIAGMLREAISRNADHWRFLAAWGTLNQYRDGGRA